MCVICLSVHCSSSCFSAASPNCSYLAFLLPLPNLLIPFKLGSQGKSLQCITACGVCPGAARLPQELPGYPGSCPVTPGVAQLPPPPEVFNILPADAGRISSVRSWLLPSTSLPVHYSTAELLSSSLNEPESGVSGLSFDFVSRVRGRAIHWTFRLPCVGIRFFFFSQRPDRLLGPPRRLSGGYLGTVAIGCSWQDSVIPVGHKWFLMSLAVLRVLEKS